MPNPFGVEHTVISKKKSYKSYMSYEDKNLSLKDAKKHGKKSLGSKKTKASDDSPGEDMS